MKRVAIIGNGAAGKTTLAHALSERLHVPHYEVDAVQYRADWTRVPTSELAPTLDEWLDRDGWVIDGFGPLACVERRLDAADTVVWIDLPLLPIETCCRDRHARARRAKSALALPLVHHGRARERKAERSGAVEARTTKSARRAPMTRARRRAGRSRSRGRGSG